MKACPDCQSEIVISPSGHCLGCYIKSLSVETMRQLGWAREENLEVADCWKTPPTTLKGVSFTLEDDESLRPAMQKVHDLMQDYVDKMVKEKYHTIEDSLARFMVQGTEKQIYDGPMSQEIIIGDIVPSPFIGVPGFLRAIRNGHDGTGQWIRMPSDYKGDVSVDGGPMVVYDDKFSKKQMAEILFGKVDEPKVKFREFT